ncbi:inverse autotransporter beta domain-containing protein, partial [Yersinia enterocolitica]|uniref:inverse autotransporter beta domain-containing protein n=1 Tax=Yersinia enterocolitica TaxID=630 RepID=UPI003D03105D
MIAQFFIFTITPSWAVANQRGVESQPITLETKQPSVEVRGISDNKNFADTWFAQNLQVIGPRLTYGGQDLAASMAQGYLNGKVNQQVDDWFGHKGSARIDLNWDRDFHLENSAVDLLFPVYDNADILFFSQFGARYRDSRSTVNIGAGLRFVQPNWLAGVNTFYDNDITGHNRRLGLGIEYWRDYLKLSANSYLALSDWGTSKDFDGSWDERPADGFDMRINGYLPELPQLGAKLVYEKYWGEQVALFDTHTLQKNPHALTLGINYTPFSLLTMGVDHRFGQQGLEDTRFTISLNYRFGHSLQSQLSPTGLPALRQMPQSSYDLVERNNEIVLRYQQHQSLHLSLPDSLTGIEQQSMIISADYQGQHPLERIDWDLSTLIAAGGSAQQLSTNSIRVSLPTYNSADSNIYRISAVAYDVNQRRSNSATSQVAVTADPVLQNTHVALTVVSPNPKTVVANGIQQHSVRVTLTDAQGSPLGGQVINLSASPGQVQFSSVAPTTDASGVATVTLTSTVAGNYTITGTASTGGATGTTAVSFIADIATASLLLAVTTADPTTVVANGIQQHSVRVTLTDAQGSPLGGQVINLSASPGQVQFSSVAPTTDASGVATVTLTSTVAGNYTITGTASTGGATGTTAVSFIADIATASLLLAVTTADPTTVVANGIQQHSVR